jgi:mono/diheme cytochrome c family protein
MRCSNFLHRGRGAAVGMALLACVPVFAQEELPKGDRDSGEQLYQRYCRGCHGEEGKGDGLTFQPHVDNLTRKGYIEHLPDAYLFLAITKGGAGIGKSNAMPAWESTLSKQQMVDIIAYIRSLPLN